MPLFQAGYIGPSGQPEIGLVAIEPKSKSVSVTLITDDVQPRFLGRFTKFQWLDQGEVNQDQVNATLRGWGLLWRRTKTEREYRKKTGA